MVAGLARAQDKAGDPERRAKIAAFPRGRPRQKSNMEPAWEANRGRKPTDETKRKMSETHSQRGTRQPKAGRAWTGEKDALVRVLPASEVATRTGRMLQAVYSRRSLLDLNDGRTARWKDQP